MIYVVEDNPSIRQIIKAYLELADFQVVEFEGVSKVVESLEFKHYCILMSALDGNGFELANKSINTTRPFLLVSYRHESESIESPALSSEERIML